MKRLIPHPLIVIAAIIIVAAVGVIIYVARNTKDVYVKKASDGTTVRYYADQLNDVCFALVNEESTFRVACDEVSPAIVVK